MTRIITVDDLAAVVHTIGLDLFFDELLAALRRVLAEHDPATLVTQDRTGFSYDQPDLGLVEWMPAMDTGRRVSIKTVGYHPTNPVARRSPSVLATTSLYDTSDGRLVAVCEATVLTALRTGAASAVATDILARPDASVLGLVGCGAQAVAQVHALSRVRPITRVLAHDTDPSVARTLPDRLSGVVDGVEVELLDADSLGRLLAEADIICTCTTVEPGAGPVLPYGEHRPWLHVNAVGADFAGKVELPLDLLRNALVCPDVPAQCLMEGEAQRLDQRDLGPDLTSLARNAREFVGHRNRLTVFDSTGWALEDLVAAELLVHHCEHLGLGTMVDLQPSASDPYDPYQGLRPRADATRSCQTTTLTSGAEL